MSKLALSGKNDRVAPLRPEFVRDAESAARVPLVVQRPLSVIDRIYNQTWLRKTLILIFLAVMWEAYGRYLDNDLLFPTFSATVSAFYSDIASGVLVGNLSR